jgi:hypothetical protein
VDKDTSRIRWGIEQRLDFIEFRLFWDGSLNRSDIIRRFGVSTPQASADLAQYRELAPENIDYDKSAKRYVATPNFRPRFEPNAERYLAQLKALTENVISLDDTWFGVLPEIDVVPIPARRADSNLLRRLLMAVRDGRSISIEYQSLNDSRPDPIWREITPHAFGSDGLRWHVRAFCHIELVFKDFLLSRCLQIGEMGTPLAVGAQDTDWHTFFEVVLVPNPKLSPAQKTTIERDYGMKDGQCILKVRHAFLYYLDKRLRLDVAEKQDRPKETPVVVANRREYNSALRKIAY